MMGSATAAQVPLRKRFRLFFRVVLAVLALGLAKALVHWLGLEFVSLNTLFTSAVGGAIFVIGFLLSSILADYKEAERLPAEMRVALESLHDDAVAFETKTDSFDADRLRTVLISTLSSLFEGLGHARQHCDIAPSIAHADTISGVITQMESLGLAPNFVVRMRTDHSTLRRCLFRVYHIQKMQFVPSVHVLVQTLVISIMGLLLFLKIEGSPESALMVGFIAYLFIYALHLVHTLEQPYRKGDHSSDDVSLFLLRDFLDKLRRASHRTTGSAAATASGVG